jgi:hypothetical protein
VNVHGTCTRSRNPVRMIVSIGSNCGHYPDSIMCIEVAPADDAHCFLLPPGHSKDVTVYIMHDCVALASESKVFTFSNAALLESECHVIVRSCLDISNACAGPEHLHQASSICFAQDSGVFVSKLDFIFKDLTQPCHVTKTCTGLFALDERNASESSCLQLLLLNDGRIITPLCYMTPLHPAQGNIPKWMIPPASSDIVRMHSRVAEQIELVQSTAASASELHLSGSLWKDPAHVVLKCVSETPDALADVQGWVSHIKRVQQKIIRKERTPLPLSARGRFLHGHFDEGGVRQQLQVSLTGEGLLFVEHMKLWAGSVVHAEGSLRVRVSNVFSGDRLGEGSFVVVFISTVHRDEGMRVFHRMIQAFADEQKWAETVIQIMSSSIDATTSDRSSHHQAMVSERGSVADIPRYLCNLWQTDPSELLAEIFNCYRGSFSHSIFDFPPSHCPPVLPLLTRAIKQLLVKYPHQFNEGLSVSVRPPHGGDILSYSSIFRIVYSQPDVEGSMCAAEEAFRNVQACVWFWTLRAIAEAAPTALLAKDDEGDTFIFNLLLKHECSYLTDQSFMQSTLKMIVEVEPLLVQQRLDDDPNKTILHVLCLNIHNVPDAFRIIQIILQQYPDFVSLPMPTEQNELPLHWLCCSNPSPRVLRLILDAFPSAATTADDDGCWPIHNLVTSCRCPESLQMLLDAAPACMQQSTALGIHPLHSAVSRWSHKGEIPDDYLVPLLRACRGLIVLDFCHRKSKPARMHFLRKLREWAAGSSACAHSHLVREILTLDIAGCELGQKLVPVLSELLPHCSELTVLDISANCLTRENLEHLLPVILQLPKLQRLVLDDNISEEEDVAIIMSMMNAPQLDVRLRCRTSQSDDDCLKDILWQAHADEDEDDDDDGGSSNEQSGDEEGADDDGDDDSVEGANADGCSEGSGWVTDEEHADDACERDERVSEAGDEDGLPEDMGHLRRLHHALERTLNTGSQSALGCCRCEGVYDSDEGDLDISVICGDDEDRNEDDDSDADRTELTIDRDHLLESSLDELQRMSAKGALRSLDVHFKDERGIDAGGLTKTFLAMVRLLYSFLMDLNVVLMLPIKVLEKLITPGKLFLPGSSCPCPFASLSSHSSNQNPQFTLFP